MLMERAKDVGWLISIDLGTMNAVVCKVVEEGNVDHPGDIRIPCPVAREEVA